jgi:3-oxoacyl-[acyl-carrier protein] reductase
MADSDRWVLLAGGSSDTGQFCVRHLATCGIIPIITYHQRREIAERLIREIREAAPGAFASHLDVTKEGSVETLTQSISQKGIKLTGVVCLCSYSRPDAGYQNSLESLVLSDVQASLAVDLIGVARLLQAVLPILQRPGGSIVTFGSASALGNDNDLLQYLPARLSMSAYTRSFARKLGPDLRINCIAPGALATSWLERWGLPPDERETLRLSTAAQRLGTPEDIAHSVEFLLSSRSAYITGQTLIVDGGLFCP